MRRFALGSVLTWSVPTFDLVYSNLPQTWVLNKGPAANCCSAAPRPCHEMLHTGSMWFKGSVRNQDLKSLFLCKHEWKKPQICVQSAKTAPGRRSRRRALVILTLWWRWWRTGALWTHCWQSHTRGCWMLAGRSLCWLLFRLFLACFCCHTWGSPTSGAGHHVPNIRLRCSRGCVCGLRVARQVQLRHRLNACKSNQTHYRAKEMSLISCRT